MPSAVETGCNHVLTVEKAPKEWVGGNGYFTAGAFRTVHAGLADLLPLVSNVLADSEHAAQIDVAPYTVDDFTCDVMHLGENKPNAALVRAVVDNSRGGEVARRDGPHAVGPRVPQTDIRDQRATHVLGAWR